MKKHERWAYNFWTQQGIYENLIILLVDPLKQLSSGNVHVRFEYISMHVVELAQTLVFEQVMSVIK